MCRLALLGFVLCTRTVNVDALCTNTCVGYPSWGSDGWCDDGGSGSQYSGCQLGTDCQDCGHRADTVCAMPPVDPNACTANADLTLVLDKSGSMDGSMEDMRDMARNIVSQFDLSSTTGRVAVVSFNGGATTPPAAGAPLGGGGRGPRAWPAGGGAAGAGAAGGGGRRRLGGGGGCAGARWGDGCRGGGCIWGLIGGGGGCRSERRERRSYCTSLAC